MSDQNNGPRWARAWVGTERWIVRGIAAHSRAIKRGVGYAALLLVGAWFAFSASAVIGVFMIGEPELLFGSEVTISDPRALRAIAYGSLPLLAIAAVLTVRHYAHRRVQEAER